LSRGGNNTAKNRVWACNKCNSNKSNMMPEEFVIFLREHSDWKKRDVDIMLKNAEALVFTIAPYRHELLKSHKTKPVRKNYLWTHRDMEFWD
jgi:hypothetical protein